MSKTFKPAKSRRLLLISCALGLSAVGLAVGGVMDRARSKQELAEWTAEQAIPTVRLVEPHRGPNEEKLVLPGTVSAFTTGSIYGRATGYVTAWYKDIGAHVRKGEALAAIDSPELDQQLAQAKADLANAKANETLARLTAGRWRTLATRNIVSQQARDEKVGDDEAKVAVVQAAQANVARLEAMAGFKELTAPFDGVVTARSVDVGDLVRADGTSGKALFRVSDLHEMRVYVNVPQAFLGGMKTGLKATLELPGQAETFEATLVSTANAISENSRTALVELQAANLDGKLWPGAFAEVHFHIPSDPGTLRIPATALVFGTEGMSVAEVDAENKVALKPVRLGRNLGNDVEIQSGLALPDRLIDSPEESLVSGQLVRIAAPASAARTAQQIPPEGAQRKAF